MTHVAHEGPWSRLLALARCERPLVGSLLALSVAVGVLTLAAPIAVQALVDAVAFGGLAQPVIVLAVVLLACLSLAAAFRALQTYVAELLQRRIFVRVMTALGRRLPRLRLDALDDEHAPELVNRFFDVVTVQKACATLLLDGFTIVLTTTAGLLLLAFYHPVLLALDLLLVAGIAVVCLVLGRGAVATSIEKSRAKYRAAAWLEEVAHHSLAFRGAGGPAFAEARTSDLTREYLARREQHFRVLFRQVLGALALQAGASTVLLGVGGWLVIEGTLTLGQLVASELIVTVVVASVAKLGKSLTTLYDLLAAMDKLGHLLDLPCETTGGLLTAVTGPAPVALEGVVADRGGRRALERLDLALAPGERVALLGAVGAGKSTVLDLVYGVRAPSAGAVVIDGHDLRDTAPDALRARVALVRGPEVVEASLLENVRFGRPGIDREQARAALAAAGLLEAALCLPAGLDTPLAAGGAPLSDAQRRLLVLARALAGQPGLLLLDRTLDDLATEDLWPFLAHLARAEASPTLLVATSRQDVAALFERVVVLERGRVLEGVEA